MERFRSLDGLRGLAAYMVVFGHFAQNTAFGRSIFAPGTGQVGVMVFFVLSGFLMGALYISRPFNSENVWSFAQKRVARVIPLYLAVVITAYTLNALGVLTYNVNNQNIASHLFFWRGEHALWTVAVEVQFYLVFPLIWWLHSRYNAALPLLLVIGVMALTNFKSPVPLLTTGHFFLFGILAALFIKNNTVAAVGGREEEKKSGKNIMFVLSAVFFVAVLPSSANALGYPLAVWISPAYLLAIPALLITCAMSPMADRLLGAPIPAFLGRISYSVYLLHMPILWILRRYTSLIDGSFAGQVLFVAIVTLVSWLSFRLFEDPARRWLSSARQPRARLA